MKHRIVSHCDGLGEYWLEKEFLEGGFFVFIQDKFDLMELYSPEQLAEPIVQYPFDTNLDNAIKHMVYLNNKNKKRILKIKQFERNEELRKERFFKNLPMITYRMR